LNSDVRSAVDIVGAVDRPVILALPGAVDCDPDDVAAVKAAKATGIPLVLVVVSGRPLQLGEVASQADAIVAAWLPGTEGAGVADVLFGDYKFKGKLSFSWKDPAFPVGFGLN